MRGLRLRAAVVIGLVTTALLSGAGCADSESAARTSTPSTPAKPKADAPSIPVQDEASFIAALLQATGGETIQLADGAYPELTVAGRSFAKTVTIAGSRNVKLAGIAFVDSANLVLTGVTVTPPLDAQAKIGIRGSSRNIVIDQVLVDGRSERVGAKVVASEGTSDVTVQNSQLTNCGHGDGCIRPGATNLRVIGNSFRDCRSCTFIKGGGNGAFVQGNTFDLVHNVECEGGQAHCPHNDLIHIQGGGPWRIVGNRFGDYKAGAAQVYANPGLSNHANPIHDLLIASNVFVGEAGVAIRLGIGKRSRTAPPKNVRVVNNTILSGRLTAVLIPDTWDGVPLEQRPLVANNVLGHLNPGNCERGRFVSNLVLRGTPCPGDQVGNAKLDAGTASPGAASTLVVDRADPRYAPATDFYGRARNRRPDRGAIELGGRAPATSLELTVPPTIERPSDALVREGWNLSFEVGLRGADTLRVRLLAGGKALTTVSSKVSGKTRHTAVIPLPEEARRPGTLVLELDALATGRGSVKRSVNVRILGS